MYCTCSGSNYCAHIRFKHQRKYWLRIKLVLITTFYDSSAHIMKLVDGRNKYFLMVISRCH